MEDGTWSKKPSSLLLEEPHPYECWQGGVGVVLPTFLPADLYEQANRRPGAAEAREHQLALLCDPALRTLAATVTAASRPSEPGERSVPDEKTAPARQPKQTTTTATTVAKVVKKKKKRPLDVFEAAAAAVARR